MNYDGKKL